MSRRFDHSRLLALLDEPGGFVSGEMLSRSLGVSRTAIWKQISALRSLGYAVEAVTSRGYRLIAAPDILDEQSISRHFTNSDNSCRRIVCLEETASTNSEAFRLAEAGAPEGTVVIADRQTAGKGRLGRQWVSPGGVNLYLSLVLRPDLPPFEAPQLTFLSAVAVARAIEDVAGLKPQIKWPNDVLIAGRKVAGLLNEMSAETDRVSFVILGIGVNINMEPARFPEGLRTPATSLRIEAGHSVSRGLFAARLVEFLDSACKSFLSFGFEPIREEWSRRCNAFGRNVRVESGSALIQGAFVGIDHDGAMLVRVKDGSVERVMSGDVTVI